MINKYKNQNNNIRIKMIHTNRCLYMYNNNMTNKLKRMKHSTKHFSNIK